jgi:hypothetical protein
MIFDSNCQMIYDRTQWPDWKLAKQSPLHAAGGIVATEFISGRKACYPPLENMPEVANI